MTAGYYIITNENETKVMSADGYMMPTGSSFPFTTYLKASAEQQIEKWNKAMTDHGLIPYNLVIKKVD